MSSREGRREGEGEGGGNETEAEEDTFRARDSAAGLPSPLARVARVVGLAINRCN